ncbi:unnamed protein product [Onchocerca flexuosa]|uniref:Uncharacterized protein n=1 Tax=Onchocerca flexuosa TaxID=387005 RepID=A0A183HT16_9BILA|nr:unnamed protein product [Onchocerca flexuosa]
MKIFSNFLKLTCNSKTTVRNFNVKKNVLHNYTFGFRLSRCRIIAYGCMPFDYDTIAQNVALRSRHAFGGKTLKSQPISSSK